MGFMVWTGLDAHPETFVGTPEGQLFAGTGFSNIDKPTCIINYTASEEGSWARSSRSFIFDTKSIAK